MEIKIIILGFVIFAIAIIVISVKLYQIRKFANNREIQKIFELSTRIYDFYKETCYKHGVEPKKDMSVNQMLEESKRIIDESNNEEDTNIYIEKL